MRRTFAAQNFRARTRLSVRLSNLEHPEGNNGNCMWTGRGASEQKGSSSGRACAKVFSQVHARGGLAGRPDARSISYAVNGRMALESKSHPSLHSRHNKSRVRVSATRVLIHHRTRMVTRPDIRAIQGKRKRERTRRRQRQGSRIDVADMRVRSKSCSKSSMSRAQRCREHKLRALECAQVGKSGERKLGDADHSLPFTLSFTDPEIERESTGGSCYPLPALHSRPQSVNLKDVNEGKSKRSRSASVSC